MSRIITNNYNLPNPILKAVQTESHKVAGQLSVSQIIDSPRIRLLKLRHPYNEDCADLLDALMGTALHSVLEKANINNKRKESFQLTMETLMSYVKDGMDEQKKESLLKAVTYLKKFSDAVLKTDDRYLTEQTLRVEVGGIVLYGTYDFYDQLTGFLEDYKSCKVFAWMFPESRQKWRVQTNVYAFMLRHHGFPVNGIVINALFKDWSVGELRRNKDYPDHKIMRVPIPMGDPIKVAAYIEERVKLHVEAENQTDENLPLCTGSERWATSDEYVVKTPKVVRALKKFGDNKHLAEQWLAESKHKHKGAFIEVRPGTSRRCESYCPVSQYCSQRKAELERIRKEADQE